MKKKKLVINPGKVIKWFILIANLTFISVLYKSSEKHEYQVSRNLEKDDLEHAKDNLENRERMKYVDILGDVIGSGTVPLYSNLVDFSIPIHILPFLPLTREHIRECTKKLYNSKNIILSPLEIQRIVDQISFFSPEFPIFAKHGCKQVVAKMKTRKSQEL